jgi:hypothetical protein
MSSTFQQSGVTGSESVEGDVVEVINLIFRRHNVVSPLEAHTQASLEADDLVAALEVRERLAGRTDEGFTLEDSMRANGVDPADFGL